MTNERRDVAHKTSAPKSEGIQIISLPLLPTILLGAALYEILPSTNTFCRFYTPSILKVVGFFYL